jgi:hypothetical protein
MRHLEPGTLADCLRILEIDTRTGRKLRKQELASETGGWYRLTESWWDAQWRKS